MTMNCTAAFMSKVQFNNIEQTSAFPTSTDHELLTSPADLKLEQQNTHQPSSAPTARQEEKQLDGQKFNTSWHHMNY